MLSIAFFVPGEAIAKGRPRARGYIRKDGKAGSILYTPDRTVAWEETVRYHALKMRPENPIDKALRIDLIFMLPMTEAAKKKKRKHPSIKPDLDNLEKAVLDALNGLMYVDDSRICEKVGRKVYTEDPGKYGVCITIETME